MELGSIIRDHRKKSKLSQKECAQLAGVGKATIFDIEHGKQTVRWDNIMKVLQVLNIQLGFCSGLHNDYLKIEP